MLNTIIILVLAIAFSVTFMRVVCDFSTMKIRMSDIIIFALCALSLYYVSVSTKAYDKGFNDAINSAELIETTANNYYISFDGEVHEYN